MGECILQKNKKRQEMDKEFQWKLEKMYADISDWEKDFTELKSLIAEMAKLPGTIAESAENLYAILSLSEKIDRKTEKLYVYSRMRRDEDNQNAVAQEYFERIQGLAVEAGSVGSFIIPEILAMDETILRGWINNTEELKMYEHFFDEVLYEKEHILSLEEERLLAMSSEVCGAPGQIFTMLNNADLRFPSVIDDSGIETEITHGRYTNLMESPNRQVREDTFKKYYSSYEKLINTIGMSYASSVKKDVFLAKVRNYPSALEASLSGDHIDVGVYDQLIESVHAKLPYMYRYLELRKKLLGVEQLHMYDIYARLIKDYELQVPYKEAKATVLKALAPLGDDYLDVLRNGMDSGWIDVYENEGKTSGAYSWGCYDSQPYVLMNYDNHLDDVYTIAHELGHSMHSYYSNTNQPYIYSQYPIFLAEVASTVNESLLSDYLLKHSNSREEKLYVYNHYLEQFRGTIYRQTMFAEFEKITHEAAEAGQGLTPEFFNKIYMDLNRLYYGENIKLDDEIRLEWARIPHFYTAFYVYKYATGFSAATMLKQQIITEGTSAVKRYREFLKSGCSQYPLETLKAAGVDLMTPEPVEESLDYFNRLMDEMEDLLKEK